MSSRPAHARPSANRGVLPSALFVGVLMVTSVNGLASAAGEPSRSPVRRVATEVARGFTWSRAQVAELIEEIRAAGTLGLDPEDYGLAALEGQLVVTSDLLGAPGSRQLDALAEAAALSLARDYREGRSAAIAGAAPSVSIADRATLRAALRSGSLRAWFQGHQRSRMPRLRPVRSGGA